MSSIASSNDEAKRFVRYADDCNIYVQSERAGQRVMASIKHFAVRRIGDSVLNGACASK